MLHLDHKSPKLRRVFVIESDANLSISRQSLKHVRCRQDSMDRSDGHKGSGSGRNPTLLIIENLKPNELQPQSG